MSEWWILVLVTLNVDGTLITEKHDKWNYKPSCQIAAEARQMYLTSNYETNKKYICLNEFKNETD